MRQSPHLKGRTRKALVLALLALALMGFDAKDAENFLNGEWQGVAMAWSLSVDAPGGKGVFIDKGRRIAGTLTIGEIVGRSVQFKIGDHRFIIHFRDRDDARLVFDDDGSCLVDEARKTMSRMT